MPVTDAPQRASGGASPEGSSCPDTGTSTFWGAFRKNSGVVEACVQILMFGAQIALAILAYQFFYVEQQAIRANVETQLKESRQLAIEERTLKFIEQFQAAHVLEAQGKLLLPIFSSNLLMQSKENIGGRMFDGVTEDLFAKDPGTYNDIIVLVQTFELGMLCVKLEQCDRTIMDDYILDTARGFSEAYSTYINQIRIVLNRPDFAKILQEYIGGNGS